MATFSDRLKSLRAKAGKNQADIAEVIGASVQSYSAYEAGREPKYEMLCQLCDYFGVTADYMLGRTDAMTPQVESTADTLGLSPNAVMNLMTRKGTRERDMQFKSLSYLINVAWDTGFFVNLFHYLFSTFSFDGTGNPKFCTVTYEEDVLETPMEISAGDLNDIYFGKLQRDLVDLKTAADNIHAAKGNVRGWE